MESILKALYHGRIYPFEEIYPHDAEYRTLFQQVIKEMDHWQERLSKEEFAKLETCFELMAESSGMVQEEAFLYGFRLGCQIIAEVFLRREPPAFS